MPLFRLSASQAMENRKTNKEALWGDRAGENRVEPIARPAFQVPFHLQPGSKIFTVGSCFARNVEEELERRGFELPMRKVILRNEPSAILNNYGTPSIYNEFAWAFGDRPYVPEEHIVEIMPGKFSDIHLSPTMRPEPRDVVLERRASITEAYRQAAECPVIIMTLGLVETWFDTQTGYYLNVSPPRSLFRSQPDRFEMHVLSFEECRDYLEKALDIIKANNRTDVRVILTVSPVPLTATFRMTDVMVANTYSKSVLRTVAETIVSKYDFVTYYPSYESVTLSDRQRAFREDLIHVTHEIVAFNVGRMVDAYIAADEDLETIGAQIAAGGEAVAVDKAKSVRTGSREIAGQFFAQHGDYSARSDEFATEHAQHLADSGDWDGALAVLESAPSIETKLPMVLLKAQALVRVNRGEEAFASLEAFAQSSDGPAGRKIRAASFWYALLEAAQASGNESHVLSTLARFSEANPVHTPRANMHVGKWFKDMGQLDRALPFFQNAASLDNQSLGQIALAECLIALGRRAEAKATLDRVVPMGPGAEFRLKRLQDLVASEQGEPAETLAK